MKIEYTNKRETYYIKQVDSGEIVRPTNSQVLFLVTDQDSYGGLFMDIKTYNLKQYVFNPQNIECNDEYTDCVCAVCLDNGEICFIPNDTEVVVMEATLTIEGE